MMIKLKSWNEVLAIGKERKEEICDCVCGISDTMLPWGKWVQADGAQDGYVVNEIPVKNYMAEEIMQGESFMENGIIIHRDEASTLDGKDLMIDIIAWDGYIWYLRVVNNEVEEMRCIGKDDGYRENY